MNYESEYNIPGYSIEEYIAAYALMSLKYRVLKKMPTRNQNPRLFHIRDNLLQGFTNKSSFVGITNTKKKNPKKEKREDSLKFIC